MNDSDAIANKDYLTLQDAAMLIGYSTRSMRKLISANQINYYRIGRKILILKSDLYTFIEQHKVATIKTL